MGNPVKYLGFIKASKDSEDLLRQLGVEGSMRWRDGNFEMCEIPVDRAQKIIPKLIQEIPYFDTVCFTGVDSNGRPVCGMNIDTYEPAYRDEWRRQNVD